MIEVCGINKSYKGKCVLTDVSFCAENGLVTGFVGPNGAGKSTTMRIIAGMEKPDRGHTAVDGLPFADAVMPPKTMGVYLGYDYLPVHMTGKAYLEYACLMSGAPKTQVLPFLSDVELAAAADKPIASYSMGMRQRLGLAAAMISNPANLMLDEPANGLDPLCAQWLREAIKGQAAAGKAVLLSSHLLSELELIADKVVMLNFGAVVKQGFLEELAESTTRKVLMSTNADAKIHKFLKKKGVVATLTDEGVLVEGIAPDRLAAFAVHNNVRLYRLDEKHESLEEVFLGEAGQGVSNAK